MWRVIGPATPIPCAKVLQGTAGILQLSPGAPERRLLTGLRRGHQAQEAQPNEDQDDETGHRVAPVITVPASRCHGRRARRSWCGLRPNRRASTPLRYRLFSNHCPHQTCRMRRVARRQRRRSGWCSTVPVSGPIGARPCKACWAARRANGTGCQIWRGAVVEFLARELRRQERRAVRSASSSCGAAVLLVAVIQPWARGLGYARARPIDNRPRR
jgi:hypothetical protein